jgi:hypothetical protein
MHFLIILVWAICYTSTAIYPDKERVIWLRSGNSEFAYTCLFWQFYKKSDAGYRYRLCKNLNSLEVVYLIKALFVFVQVIILQEYGPKY